jgi:N-acetylmuramoyl-L-alanine amidase
MAKNTPKYIIVHHTGGVNSNPLADTSHHTLESIKHWHVKGRGWQDVGYHYVIEKNGDVRKGRAEDMHGAHAKGYNKKSIGICLAGNFDLTLPTEAQVASLKGELNRLVEKYQIPVENVIPHRTVANKTCYGMNLPENWAQNLVSEPEFSLKDVETSDLIKELLSRLSTS